ncbi:hypothetical protein DEJ33_10140 [Curtobacterium sp. MCPF17_047]|nr:hypothetical protein DEJ24_00715 [Curtobacterium sp. MCPF17_001]PZF65619.1 hypothetical protein DEJ33_10140 [Curtobacterium sp. MCPF17_047]
MKRMIGPVMIAAVLVLSGCSAAGSTNSGAESKQSSTAAADTSTTTPTPTPTAPDLVGTWKQNNSASADGYTSATITADTITVEFVTDNGDTRSLFWVGTYTPPTDGSEKYTWTSKRDEAATASALLASTDPTKDFVYDDEEISFPVTIAGTTATVRMSKD